MMEGIYLLCACGCPLTHFEDAPVGEQASDEGHSVWVLAESISLEVQQEDLVRDGQLDQRHLLGGGAAKGGLPLHVQADHASVLCGRPPKKQTNNKSTRLKRCCGETAKEATSAVWELQGGPEGSNCPTY